MIALMLALSLATPVKKTIQINAPPSTWQFLGSDLDRAFECVGNQLDSRYGPDLATDRQFIEYIYKGTDSVYTVYYAIEGVLHERLKAEGVTIDTARHIEQFYRVNFVRYAGHWYASPEQAVGSLP